MAIKGNILNTNYPECIFNNIGLKFIIEHEDGNITTFHTTFDKPINDVINEEKTRRRWIGCKFTEIYLIFKNKQVSYIEYFLDIKKHKFNLLLKK